MSGQVHLHALLYVPAVVGQLVAARLAADHGLLAAQQLLESGVDAGSYQLVGQGRNDGRHVLACLEGHGLRLEGVGVVGVEEEVLLREGFMPFDFGHGVLEVLLLGGRQRVLGLELLQLVGQVEAVLRGVAVQPAPQPLPLQIGRFSTEARRTHELGGPAHGDERDDWGEGTLGAGLARVGEGYAFADEYFPYRYKFLDVADAADEAGDPLEVLAEVAAGPALLREGEEELPELHQDAALGGLAVLGEGGLGLGVEVVVRGQPDLHAPLLVHHHHLAAQAERPEQAVQPLQSHQTFLDRADEVGEAQGVKVREGHHALHFHAHSQREGGIWGAEAQQAVEAAPVPYNARVLDPGRSPTAAHHWVVRPRAPLIDVQGVQHLLAGVAEQAVGQTQAGGRVRWVWGKSWKEWAAGRGGAGKAWGRGRA